MKHSWTDGSRWLARRRGSALVLTMLILLVLSGLGMVAMRDISRSLHQSGAYRVRTQADHFSEAAAEYATADASTDAASFWSMMESSNENNVSSHASSTASQKAQEELGGYVLLTQQSGGSGSTDQFEALTSTADESGLLNDSGHASFEASEPSTQFAVIFRDPMDGPPAPGYGDKYCFKKVTIASRALVGQPNRTWKGAGMMAEKRNGIETLIGPIECGAH